MIKCMIEFVVRIMMNFVYLKFHYS